MQEPNAPCSLSRHSGVTFYIHTDFAYNIVNEVCDNTTFESLTINVQLSTENIVISNVYRPPRDNYGLFNDELDKYLNHLSPFESIIMMGGFNINLIEINTNADYLSYLHWT